MQLAVAPTLHARPMLYLGPPPRPGPAPVPLGVLLDRYVASLAARAPKTRQTYTGGLRVFCAFLASRGVDVRDDGPALLWPTVLEDFGAALLGGRPTPKHSTIATYSAAVKGFLRYIIHRGLAPGLNYEAMRDGLRELLGKPHYRPPRIDRRIPLVVQAALDAPLPDVTQRLGAGRLELLRDRALLLVLFGTAMRRAEVASLNRQDVDEGHADEALVIGKGDKERMAFFDADTLAAIRAYLDARQDQHWPLFLRHDNRRGRPGTHGEAWRLSGQSVWFIVKQYARAAGVPATTHHFRHAKASLLLNRGASLSDVQDILGHADPSTTKRVYAHLDTATLRASFHRHSASLAELVEQLAR